MEKFLELFAEIAHKYPGYWLKFRYGCLRFTTFVKKFNMTCPIDFVYFDRGGNENMEDVQKRGVELGLSADNIYGHDRDLRGKILEIVGLTP
jgi:hypothetical protein